MFTSHYRLVLCECRQAIDPKRIPPEVSRGEMREPWTVIVMRTPESASDNVSAGFTEKFAKFLMDEGKSLSDVHALISPHSAPDSSPKSIIRAMGEVLEKTAKHSSDSNTYRRLRTFSAVVPTPMGEENMENCIDQARLLITEGDCSEKEKRRRIVESLKGPAMDIVRTVRFSDPEASASQYLEALESTFGSSESGEDLYFKFRLMRQGTGEALSEFLRRMEKTLSKVIERDGLTLSMVDKVRVEQLIIGAVNSDMMLLQLRLRERKNHPTSYLSLLKEISEVEESEVARHRTSAKAKAILFHEDERTSVSVIQEFKAELQELRTQISGVAGKDVSTASLVIKTKEKPLKRTEKTDDSQVQELKKQVQHLQKQLAVLSVSSTAYSPHVPGQRPKPCQFVPAGLSYQSARTRDDYFCYNCGEDGHIATKCQAPPKLDQVIQKLIRSLRQAKGGKGEMADMNYSKPSLFL
ncbi:paraneoplastic antigen Ma1 homolog [Siphateles boraxobius]|uniref:paraneoplastic antigen Ma1 homolog n=1 Tax=Siphateles boraxobius TaxID=180520 RepID=UPI004062EC15